MEDVCSLLVRHKQLRTNVRNVFLSVGGNDLADRRIYRENDEETRKRRISEVVEELARLLKDLDGIGKVKVCVVLPYPRTDVEEGDRLYMVEKIRRAARRHENVSLVDTQEDLDPSFFTKHILYDGRQVFL